MIGSQDQAFQAKNKQFLLKNHFIYIFRHALFLTQPPSYGDRSLLFASTLFIVISILFTLYMHINIYLHSSLFLDLLVEVHRCMPASLTLNA